MPQRVNGPQRGGSQDNEHDSSTERSSATQPLPANAIAVVGMAGRFPGAESVSAFWRNLRAGVESIVDLSEDDLHRRRCRREGAGEPHYIRRAALMDGIDEFDAEFFGFTPQAARMLDPQHRLFLQSAWHALEDAGYDPARSRVRSACSEPVRPADTCCTT